jgi:hypothetical protein
MTRGVESEQRSIHAVCEQRSRDTTKSGAKKTSKGAIAQLGEHLLCKQGVVGSIPTGSRGKEEGRKEREEKVETEDRPFEIREHYVLCQRGHRKFFKKLVERKRSTLGDYSSLTLLSRTMILRNGLNEGWKHAALRETIWGYMVKKISAQGGCLGSKRRRKTRQPAKSPGELATSIDPRISEWGNPIREILSSWSEYIGPEKQTWGTETSKYP